MLGFHTNLQPGVQTSPEGLDTSNLDKNALYDLVSSVYFVAPMSSKGLTRATLLKTYRNEIFRLTIREYKEFELTLTKAQQKKVGIVNNALLVRKLNQLLKMRGLKELGYSEFEIPDQSYLYKLARYIDYTNILEFFECAVTPEPPLTPKSLDISRIYHGRIYAAQWLFRLDQARTNKNLWEALREISEHYRAYISAKVNQDLLEFELQQTRNKVAGLHSTLNDLVGKATFTYSACEDPNIRPDLVILGDSSLTPQMREQINTNAKL